MSADEKKEYFKGKSKEQLQNQKSLQFTSQEH